MSALHPHLPFSLTHRAQWALAVALVVVAAAVTAVVLLVTGGAQPAIGDVGTPGTSQGTDLGGPIDSCSGAPAGTAC
ncbi:hypothetical protein [Modestobacter sp. NPDC049651]|uniref:hypothetical protein n=1 Tax=unclassified Modestobacter TaxID=2643866 RepID=UPI003403FB87